MENAFPHRDQQKTLVQHLSERMAYYSRYATGKVGVSLESCSYNKSYLSPKAYCFSKIIGKKPSLVVSSRCLTPFNSACISFTSSQVHSLVRIYHRAMWVHLRVSILRGDGPLLSHVISISPMTSRTILFYLSIGGPYFEKWQLPLNFETWRLSSFCGIQSNRWTKKIE
jgi:hypothetical protein